MNNELKPCPFCGGEAHFIPTRQISTSIGVGFSYIIACSKCNCTPMQKEKDLYIYLSKDGKIKIDSGSNIGMQNAIKDWNTRK